jgi:hypothetical protein
MSLVEYIVEGQRPKTSPLVTLYAVDWTWASNLHDGDEVMAIADSTQGPLTESLRGSIKTEVSGIRTTKADLFRDSLGRPNARKVGGYEIT